MSDRRDPTSPSVPALEPSSRRRYQRPRLTGHLAEITAMIGNSGADDNPTPGKGKTST